MNPQDLQMMVVTYAMRGAVTALIAVCSIIVMRRIVLEPQPGLLTLLKRPLWQRLALGLALGVAALLIALLPPLLFGAYNPSSSGYVPYKYEPLLAGAAPGYFWLLFFFQSLWEELLFRGIAVALLATLLYWLYRLVLIPRSERDGNARQLARAWFASGTLSALIVAVIFAVVHGANPNVSNVGLIGVCLAGMALGQLFWNEASIFGVWMFHFIWNAVLCALGLPVSGWALSEPHFGIGMRGATGDLISGGAFGPEGSVFALLAMLSIYLYLLYAGWRTASAVPQASSAPQQSAVQDDAAQ